MSHRPEFLVHSIGLLPDGQTAVHQYAATNFAAGNAEFFDPDNPRAIQLRPLLSSDVDVRGVGHGADTILWVRNDIEGWYCAYYVCVPPSFRTNDLLGVIRAVQYVETKLGASALSFLAPIVSRTVWRGADAIAR